MMPEMVRCPVCQKIGYTDERHQVEGAWPCAKHYREMMSKPKNSKSWTITIYPENHP